jgi:hypothetical protein
MGPGFRQDDSECVVSTFVPLTSIPRFKSAAKLA